MEIAPNISHNISTGLDLMETNRSYEPIDSIVDDSLVAVFVPIVLVWLMLIGIIGNGSLVYIVLREKSLRTLPNALIINMSIGDLLVLVFSVPFFIIVFGSKHYPFDESICKLNAYLRTLSLSISIFTLTALSWDRYVAIVHPMRRHRGNPRVKITVIVCVIWISSGIVAVPDAVSFTLEEHSGVSFCSEVPYTDYSKNYLRYRDLLRFLFLFVIPLFVIGGLYSLMARNLVCTRHELQNETDSYMTRQQRRQVRDRLKVAKFVLSLVLLFVLCWLPRHIYVLWYAWDESDFTDFWMILKIISICLMYAYSCVNPYALFFLSHQFRKFYALYLFRSCMRSRHRTRSSVRRGTFSVIRPHSKVRVNNSSIV